MNTASDDKAIIAELNRQREIMLGALKLASCDWKSETMRARVAKTARETLIACGA